MERNLFQILITGDGAEPPLSQDVVDNIASLRSNHPGYAYHRLDNAALESLLDANFGTDTLEAFRTLEPFAYKADLGRYALLLVHGGIYADVAMRILRPIRLSAERRLLCFRDMPHSGPWAVSNGLMAARSGSEALRLAVEMIVANVRNGYYGSSSLHPTGPALLGRALAITDRLEDIDLGTFSCLTNDNNPHNLGYVDSSGRIVALRMKTGSFAQLGIPRTNVYYELWDARMIYGESIDIGHDDPRVRIDSPAKPGVRRDADGISFTSDTTGIFVYGPYVDLPRGRYVASYTFAPGASLDGLTIDICLLASTIVSRDAEASDGEHVAIAFALEQRFAEVEVRLSSDGGACGTVLGLSIRWDA